ncbi:ADP-ribosylation factor family-domain-containing protein [Phakopsora pachyrhizi]|uniref:ADP-ribosylation factor family-domain-containing protein n=1 Tax=Phakopsora pachyrhizi TaxID=170000 RepID=A0AAV0AXP2_PHAPC|nr:ADP-ribosylation factor family-domain-containing protein [Phakopsora pachyrhizi]
MHKNFSLNIWDIGGQTSLRAYWRNYFESTDSMVWVIDSVDRERLNDTKFELDKLLLEERLQGASLLVFANKQDLDGSLSISELEDRAANPIELAQFYIIKKWGCNAQQHYTAHSTHKKANYSVNCKAWAALQPMHSSPCTAHPSHMGCFAAHAKQTCHTASYSAHCLQK